MRCGGFWVLCCGGGLSGGLVDLLFPGLLWWLRYGWFWCFGVRPVLGVWFGCNWFLWVLLILLYLGVSWYLRVGFAVIRVLLICRCLEGFAGFGGGLLLLSLGFGVALVWFCWILVVLRRLDFYDLVELGV